MYILIFIIFLIFIMKIKINKSKNLNLNLNLNDIKEKFNKNKKKIYFNNQVLPVNTSYDFDKNNILNLFNYIFKNCDINLIDILHVKIYSIENQKIHDCIFKTDKGLIQFEIISNKENNLKKNQIIITDYLNKLIYLDKYEKNETNLNYLEKRKKNMNDYEIDLNPEISNFNIYNLIN